MKKTKKTLTDLSIFKTCPTKIISIDTGANGGISVFRDGEIFCSPFLSTENALKFIKEKIGENFEDAVLVIESLNIFSNVNGSKNTVFKQGIAFGACLGLCLGLGVKHVIQVSARMWQSYLDVPKGIDYKERKEFLKSKAEEFFPKEMNLQKTKKYKNSVCDSLLILKYFLNNFN